MITYDDFSKLDIRIGEILSAERVPDTDKLLKLLIDVGEESPRTIVAGIAEYKDTESLPGTRVVVLVNLKPRKLRGIISEGMILCATKEEGEEKELSLLVPQIEIAPGARIR